MVVVPAVVVVVVVPGATVVVVVLVVVVVVVVETQAAPSGSSVSHAPSPRGPLQQTKYCWFRRPGVVAVEVGVVARRAHGPEIGALPVPAPSLAYRQGLGAPATALPTARVAVARHLREALLLGRPTRWG